MPYLTSEKTLFKKGNDGIIEVPLSASLLPYLSTTMRIFPNFTALQRRIMAFESSLTGKPIVFDTHPNEFIDESDEERKIHKRSDNVVAAFLQDTLRSKLKVKNLGVKGLKIYEREIKYFSENNFKFMNINDYCKEIGLLP